MLDTGNPESVAHSLDTESAVTLVDSLLRHATALDASDVHLNPTASGLDVLMRCDGIMTRLAILKPELTSTVIGRFKVLADLLVYRTDVPQEGRIPIDRTGIDSEVRIATYPTLMGERVAVRLDARRGESLGLGSLGFAPDVTAALVEAIEQPEGVVLLTGPSGSGKTTTLYSCLEHLVGRSHPRSILTVEDPIERRIDGVTQTEVNESVGLTYNVALQSILRQDPEVILIGEIRDHVTAATALEAGLTGHFVASTIHAGTAPKVFSRLMEMGIEPFAMTSVVRGVLSQRLLRRVCVEAVANHDDCAACDGSGYYGRALIAEWVPMSAPLRQAILDKLDCEGLTEAASVAGYRDLSAEAQALVEAFITTEEEVDRVLGNRMQYGSTVVARGGGGSGLVSSNARGDVSGRDTAAEGAAPLVPRPGAGGDAERGGGDGEGHRAGDDPGGGLRGASEAPAVAVPRAD